MWITLTLEQKFVDKFVDKSPFMLLTMLRLPVKIEAEGPRWIDAITNGYIIGS